MLETEKEVKMRELKQRGEEGLSEALEEEGGVGGRRSLGEDEELSNIAGDEEGIETDEG